MIDIKRKTEWKMKEITKRKRKICNALVVHHITLRFIKILWSTLHTIHIPWVARSKDREKEHKKENKIHRRGKDKRLWVRERKKECDRIRLKKKRTLWLGDILVVCCTIIMKEKFVGLWFFLIEISFCCFFPYFSMRTERGRWCTLWCDVMH